MERSILYNIEPIGKGTPLVESLTSYITRLADAHCVLTGDLISMVYAPLLNKEYLTRISRRGGNGFFDSAIGINGLGKLALEFSDLTEKFTGRSDISSTTLQNWSVTLPNRGLLKTTKSWCPYCYEQSRLNDEVIYDPLIWNFQLVNYCLKHKKPLENICGNCSNTVPVINRKSHPGYCSRCGAWLGNTTSMNEGILKNTNKSLSYIQFIGELLANNDLQLSNRNPTNSLKYYIDEVFDKSPSKAAQSFNIPRSTLMMWINGKHLPTLKYLLVICKILGISLIEFLHTKNPQIKIGSTKTIETGRIKHDHKKIRRILNKVIETKQPISISELARMIGCDRRLLSRMYETECNQIKEIYNDHLQEKKEDRLITKTNQLKDAVNLLVKQGVYPSRRQIEDILGTGFPPLLG